MNELARTLIQRLETLAQSAGRLALDTAPYISSDQIQKIDDHQKLLILGRVAFQQKLIDEALTYPDGTSLDVRMFRNALSHHNLKTVDDVESHFEPGDMIEIYDPATIQIYHNLEFQRIATYDLATLYSRPFTELWTRPASIVNAMMEMAVDMLACGYRTEKLNIPHHYVRETLKKSTRAIGVKFNVISPLLDENDNIAAFVATARCTVRDFTLC